MEPLLTLVSSSAPRGPEGSASGGGATALAVEAEAVMGGSAEASDVTVLSADTRAALPFSEGKSGKTRSGSGFEGPAGAEGYEVG